MPSQDGLAETSIYFEEAVANQFNEDKNTISLIDLVNEIEEENSGRVDVLDLPQVKEKKKQYDDAKNLAD